MVIAQKRSPLWVFNKLIDYLHSNYQSRLRGTGSIYVVLKMQLCRELSGIEELILFLQRELKRSKNGQMWYLLPLKFQNYYFLYTFQKKWNGQVNFMIIGELKILNKIHWEALTTPILPKANCSYSMLCFKSREPLASQANLFIRLAYLFAEACDPIGFWSKLVFLGSNFYQSSEFMHLRSLSFIYEKKLKQILKFVESN
jgi:hypothetical protein